MPRLTPEQRDEVVRRYVAGENSTSLAKEFNVVKSSIFQLLRVRGVKIRTMSEVKRFYQLNQNFFNTFESEQSQYWAGFIFADGHIRCRHRSDLSKFKGQSQLSVGLSDVDVLHLYKLKDALSSEHTVSVNKGACVFSISSDQLADSILNAGKYTGSIDHRLWKSRHFWRGVVDGDGSIFIWRYKNYLFPRLTLVGEYRLVNDFKNRWALSRHKSKASINPHKSIFQYSLTGSVAVDCIRWLYVDATVYLDRKYETAQRILSEFG